MKKNKKLIILILLLLIIIAVILIIYMFFLNKKKENKNSLEYECIKKGNICSKEEIFNGIKIPVELNDNQTKDFYVISNTENTLSLILEDDLLENIDWQVENINYKGPNTALYNILSKTENWDIPIIENYIYEDRGNLYYKDKCENENNQYYNCENTDITHPGYINYEIKEGITTCNFNIESTEDLDIATSTTYDEFKAKARLITVEELENISNNGIYPTWLISNLKENEGYWTATSATTINVNYYYGAYAVINLKGKTSIEALEAKNMINSHKINIRPVITINKK